MQAFLRAKCLYKGSRRAQTTCANSLPGPSRQQHTYPLAYHLESTQLASPSSQDVPSPQLQHLKSFVATSQPSSLHSPHLSCSPQTLMVPSTPSKHIGEAATTRLLTSEFLSGSRGPVPVVDGQQQQNWQPLANEAPSIPKMHTYLVLLNWNLSKRLPDFWDKAGTHICADGGSNRLHDELPAMMPDQDPEAIRLRFLPSVIKGDLDSIRPEVLAFYKSHKVPVVDSSADQDTTDLTKCIAYIEQHLKLEEAQLQQPQHVSPRICVEAAKADQSRYQQLSQRNKQQSGDSRQQAGQPYSGSAGQGADVADGSVGKPQRPTSNPSPHHHHQQPAYGNNLSEGSNFDSSGRHQADALMSSVPGFGSKSTLEGLLQHKHQIIVLGALGGRLDHTLAAINTLHMFPDLNIILLGDGNLVRLVPQGSSVLRPNRAEEGPMCGLVPMRGPAIASSAGLCWNLDHTEMAFGGLVSTSNKICADEIAIQTDCDLVWTVELRD